MSKIGIRILLVSFYAFLIMLLVGLTVPDNIRFNGSFPRWLFLLLYLFFFNLNTEGSFYFDRFLNRKLPWYHNPRKRLFIQLGFVFLWTVVTIGIPFTIWYFYNGQSFVYPIFSVLTFIAAIIFLMGFIGISMTINFFREWQTSLLEVEHLKQEKLKADYRILQNQVNPHFLFNSLNVLIAEIKHNPNIAVEFTHKLSKVYRYVLQSKNYDLTDLKKELEFIESFLFLHKVRIGDALSYIVKIPESTLQKQLPPLTLQIMIENALKHNIVNENNILSISIEAKNENKLVVRNNLNPKLDVNSTNTGLSNVRERFKLLKQDGFDFKKTSTEFIVNIPLIDN